MPTFYARTEIRIKLDLLAFYAADAAASIPSKIWRCAQISAAGILHRYEGDVPPVKIHPVSLYAEYLK